MRIETLNGGSKIGQVTEPKFKLPSDGGQAATMWPEPIYIKSETSRAWVCRTSWGCYPYAWAI